ncbi:DUF5054 domain-containing protein [Metabacillus dongyingensis]|uniref:DUF5054 domain-containing protein n=1 Tax=Metabacillus dongyingensis TaxID=2874282 RepID=UPI001CBE7EB8|nr:DUF5054 domain-containing protein [Metabacillus dongyingensis]UAL52064.1 DUF5054 domain-containing protein [Metabacillus dongyingensis]
MREIEVVHVVFKTHLDIGFTDLAENVTNQYIQSYIPKAIELSRELEKEKDSAGFVWTTGSWLIHEYLKRANADEKKVMDDAISRGYIAWHGLPFTTHTELMDKNLFKYALTIAKNLDAEYGKKTIAGKMTDVPGHTKAMIPLLAESGIKYLHFGVNPASKVPSVPNLFVWKAEDGSDVIVNYADNYGDVLRIDGLNEVMVFAHTGDNCGPPSIEDIKQEFAGLRERFPNASIKASTMDAFAEKLLAIKHTLPVVHEEIGDTWIHGAGTDPKKVAEYRELIRLRNTWITQGRLEEDSEEFKEFSDWLLLIPEHTWGLDEKKYLNDYKHYAKQDFKSARERDLISKDAVPDKYGYIGSFAMHEFDNMSKQLFSTTWENRSYSLFESSWKEQRGFLQKAVGALSSDKQQEVKAALEALVPVKNEGNFLGEMRTGAVYSLGEFQVSFSDDGSISRLLDQSGKEWASQDQRLGVFSYESFGTENYQTWFKQYVENLHQTYRWSEADQGKPGMELVEPIPVHTLYRPELISLTKHKDQSLDRVYVNLRLPVQAAELYGAPREVEIIYTFLKHEPTIDIEMNWFEKDANRLPEAIWFSFSLQVDNPSLWKMDKMGTLISPYEVVKNGNRNLHGIQSGVTYHGADGWAVIETKDVPLVSPGEKRLLQLDNKPSNLENGFHFNLYNNVWGTNFPMWYEEDAKFRFSLKLHSYEK